MWPALMTPALTPSTTGAFYQVFCGRPTHSGVIDSDISAVQAVFWSGFDSRQLDKKQARPKGLACFVSDQPSLDEMASDEHVNTSRCQ